MQFGATSTADDVLADVGILGKRVLVTGVSSGVGVEIARVLAGHGAEIVGTARDRGKAASALERAGCETGVEVVPLDLSSLSSVNDCANALLESARPIDVIIANAGVMAIPFERTADGFETQFATNYLGHFLLLNRLAPLLRAGGRTVMVSSAGHRGADVDLEDPSFRRKAYEPLVAYRQSKTAMVLFTVEFDRRHKDQDVRSTAVHPGAVLTETTRKMIEAQPSAASAFTWKTVAQGAATPVWAGFVASAEEVGGRYCEDCHVAAVDDDPAVRSGVRSYALEQGRAEELWLASEEMVSERF